MYDSMYGEDCIVFEMYDDAICDKEK